MATQDKVLYTKHFKPNGPQKVINYFRFVAEEVRELMAELGIRRFEDLIGRADLLEILPGQSKKQQGLDLTPILSDHGVPADKPHYCIHPKNSYNFV